MDIRSRDRNRLARPSLSWMQGTSVPDEEHVMVTWVLTDEPDELVAKAIAIVEARVGSSEDQEVMWLSPGPLAEPVQE